MGKMLLHFTHPRTSVAYDAQVDPQCTGQVALQGLQSPATGPFLDPAPADKPYTLVHARTSATIPASVTMVEANVVDGDIIEVRQNASGA